MDIPEGKESERRLLLTTREAAIALAISERKLWELTNRKEIPSVRIGRAVRYRITDLEEFVRPSE